ncbi:MAG: hypothetical protein LBT45_00425 [Rickettsiales bacterium]|jgi:hypothetical protein|nr:hypothetical protein [Rickettsiales bacterium]
MKNAKKTNHPENQIAKRNRDRRLGAGLAAIMTLVPLAAGCENPANGNGTERQVNATFDIKMWEKKISVTCPENLKSASQAKLEEVMALFESTFTSGSTQKDNLETLLSKDVKIIIINDGSVEDCKKSDNDGYTMLINYKWLSSNENLAIGDKMYYSFGQMMPPVTKLIDNSKGTVHGGKAHLAGGKTPPARQFRESSWELSKNAGRIIRSLAFNNRSQRVRQA